MKTCNNCKLCIGVLSDLYMIPGDNRNIIMNTNIKHTCHLHSQKTSKILKISIPHGISFKTDAIIFNINKYARPLN